MDRGAMAFCRHDARSLGLLKLFCVALTVPLWEYALLAFLLLCIAFYHAMEFHFLHDLLHGFAGDPVQLVYNSSSKLASHILPKCKILHQRYLTTPWLSGPHLQTAFLSYFGRPPAVNYHRQLVRTPDGGTIALDWLTSDNCGMQGGASSSDKMPIVVIVPGLTSDSKSSYVKHLANDIVKKGWKAVVANHRGLGGVSMTSDQVYNAGWTEDIRRIVNYLHHQYSNVPLLAVGTSIGANVLVKYLGEERENTPLGAAVSICNPWDLLVCERFICHGVIRRFYNKLLALGLRQFAEMHQHVLAPMKIADWDLVSKSQSMRDFDNSFTVLHGKFETVDTYYRKTSSVFYLNSVSIPLLGMSCLDDPVCSKEAIPWDEARANPNVVLGVTRHGGHVACFEGFTARSIWWVRASMEFLSNIVMNSAFHLPRKIHVPCSGLSPILESAIDKGPYLNISQTGMVSAENVYARPVEVGEAFDDTDAIEDSQKHGEHILHTDHLNPPASGDNISEPIGKRACNLKSFAEDDLTESSPWNLKSEFEGEKLNMGHVDDAGSISVADKEPLNQFLKISIKNHSDILALELALSHLLSQVQSVKNSEKNGKV